MAIEKYIIDKSDLTALLRGEDLAIMPKRNNIRGFCVEITGDLTNGDMIKAMFPDTEEIEDRWDEVLVKVLGSYRAIKKSWWNAPYKENKE